MKKSKRALFFLLFLLVGFIIVNANKEPFVWEVFEGADSAPIIIARPMILDDPSKPTTVRVDSIVYYKQRNI